MNVTRRQFASVQIATAIDVAQPVIIDLLTRVTVKTIEGEQEVVVRDGRVIARSFDIPMRYDIDCAGQMIADVLRTQLRVVGLPTKAECDRRVLR